MPTLGQFVVELAVKGAEAFASAISGAQAKMLSMEQVAQRMGSSVAGAMMRAEQATMGFVRAGLVGTVEGNKLSFMFAMLSRQIAGIFLPAIRTVTDIVAELTRRLQALTGAQQDQIQHWALITLGVLATVKALNTLGLMGPIISGVGAALGAVLGAINPVVLAIGAVAAALALVKVYADDGFGGLVKVWNTIVSAVQPVLDALKQLWSEHGPKILEMFNTFSAAAKDFGEAIGGMLVESIKSLGPVLVEIFGLWIKVQEMVFAGLTKLLQGFTWLARKIRELLEMVGIMSPQEQAAPDNQPKADKKPGDRRGHEEPTLAVRGFESITQSYARVQEAVNKRFDPAIAAADHKNRDERRDAILDKIHQAIVNKPVGAGA